MSEYDINNPTLTEGDELIGGEGYQDQQPFPPPPPEGLYDFSQGEPTFTEKEGILGVVFGDPREGKKGHVITGGPQDGKAVTFDRLSSKVFDRNGVKASTIVDHLRALGVKQAFKMSDHDGLKAAILDSVGKPFKAQLGWEGRCQACGEQLDKSYSDRKSQDYKDANKRITFKGARKFPRFPNGDINHIATCPECGGEVQARARITRRVPA